MKENQKAAAKNAKVNNNTILNEGEYIVWTYGDYGDPYETKKEALAARKKFFGDLYGSEAEMDRYIPVHREIWTREFGLEGDVPVCNYEKRLKDIEKKNEIRSEIEQILTADYEKIVNGCDTYIGSDVTSNGYVIDAFKNPENGFDYSIGKLDDGDDSEMGCISSFDEIANHVDMAIAFMKQNGDLAA